MALDDTLWGVESVTAAKLNALGLFSFTNVASLPSSNFDVGAKAVAEDTGVIYQNTGSYATPTWTALGLGGSPVGTVSMYAGTEASVPSAYKVCDGQAISRTTYADLFAIMGTEYGVGDGSTTFNVPDFQSSNIFPRGATDDAGRGTTGGSSTHVLTTSQMPVHNHSVSDPGHNHTTSAHSTTISSTQSSFNRSGTNSGSSTLSTNTKTTGLTVNNAGSGSAHENKPPFLDIHFIIKVI